MTAKTTQIIRLSTAKKSLRWMFNSKKQKTSKSSSPMELLFRDYFDRKSLELMLPRTSVLGEIYFSSFIQVVLTIIVRDNLAKVGSRKQFQCYVRVLQPSLFWEATNPSTTRVHSSQVALIKIYYSPNPHPQKSSQTTQISYTSFKEWE